MTPNRTGEFQSTSCIVPKINGGKDEHNYWNVSVSKNIVLQYCIVKLSLMQKSK